MKWKDNDGDHIEFILKEFIIDAEQDELLDIDIFFEEDEDEE